MPVRLFRWHPRDHFFLPGDALTIFATPVLDFGAYPLVSLSRKSQGRAVQAPEMFIPCRTSVRFKPSVLPRLRRFVCPFQNKVLPTGFHSPPSFHPQVLASDPRGSRHIPGLHEV